MPFLEKFKESYLLLKTYQQEILSYLTSKS